MCYDKSIRAILQHFRCIDTRCERNSIELEQQKDRTMNIWIIPGIIVLLCVAVYVYARYSDRIPCSYEFEWVKHRPQGPTQPGQSKGGTPAPVVPVSPTLRGADSKELKAAE